MKTARIAPVTAILLSACVSIADPPRFAQAEVGNAPTADLCDDYYRSQNPEALAELDRRQLLSEKDREALVSRRAVIGMRSSAALCLYGSPQTINDTTSAAGRTEQWVYCANYMLSAKLRDLGKPSLFSTPESMATACGNPAYLYFDNGALTATQNLPVPYRPPSGE